MALHYIVGSLDKEKNLRLKKVPELNQGESGTTAVRIDVPVELVGFSYYLEFFCPKNKKFIVGPLARATDTVVENQLEYVLESGMLAQSGVVYMQLCARSAEDDSVVFKSVRSSNASFFVNESIDADGEPYASDDMLGKLLKSFEALSLTTEEIAKNAQEVAAAGSYATEVAEGLIADRDAGLFKGNPGDTGPRGETGPKGDKGDRGEKGERGEKGDRGERGEKGATGDPGAVKHWYFSVAEMEADYANPTIAYNDIVGIASGDEDNGKVYAKLESGWIYVTTFVGVKGDKGDKGEPGATPEIGIAAVTLEAGSNANVTKSGTVERPAFLFGIPRGLKGDKGADGARGEKGDKGDKGDVGDDGQRGADGQPGATPQLVFSATSLPPGATPTVSQAGTALFPSVSLGIPKGDKGDKGDTGERGLQGVQGNKGDKGDTGATPQLSAEVNSIAFDATATVVKSGTDLNPVFTFNLPKGEPASMKIGDPISGYQNGYVLMVERGFLSEMRAADYDSLQSVKTLLGSMFSFDSTTSTLSIALDTALL